MVITRSGSPRRFCRSSGKVGSLQESGTSPNVLRANPDNVSIPTFCPDGCTVNSDKAALPAISPPHTFIVLVMRAMPENVTRRPSLCKATRHPTPNQLGTSTEQGRKSMS